MEIYRWVGSKASGGMMKCVDTCTGTAAAHTYAMRSLRFVVLLPVFALGGCYSDAPPQSTFPEPQYVAGPPGGAGELGTSSIQDPGNPGYQASKERRDADPAVFADPMV